MFKKGAKGSRAKGTGIGRQYKANTPSEPSTHSSSYSTPGGSRKRKDADLSAISPSVHGMRDRQFRATGSTNDKISKYYKGSLAGDGPENNPCDNTRFNDLVDGVGFHVSATQKVDRGPKGNRN